MNEYDGYTLTRARPEDTDAMCRLLREVCEALENKDLFAVDTEDEAWFREQILSRGFGILAHAANGELAGMLVVHIPDRGEENLGHDIGLTGDALDGVAHLDTACVAPAHRGHHLEQRMFLYAEALLPAADWPYLMCTISPFNVPSLKTAERCGYRVAHTGLKYGGHLRHTMVKERPFARRIRR